MLNAFPKTTSALIKKQNRQIILNMATGPLPVITNLAIFFFLAPYMVGKMDLALRGVWWLINDLTSYLVLVQASAGGAITKYVAEHNARGDRNMIRRVVSTGIAEYLILALAAAVAGGVICLIADKIPGLHAPDIAFSHVRLALGIMVLNLVLNLPFLGIRAAIAGFQRYDFLNLLNVVSTIIRALATVCVLASGHRLVALSLCFFAISLLANIVSVIFLHKIHPISFSLHHCKWSVLKTMFNFGLFSLISGLAATVFHRIDTGVIGVFLDDQSSKQIAIYGIGMSLLVNIRQIYQPVIRVLMPVASEYSALPPDERREKMEELFTRGSRFPVIMTLPIILFLVILGREFISLWMRAKLEPLDIRQSHIIFVILAIPNILTISWQAGAQMLVGLAKHRFPAYLFIVAAGLNLALSIIFIHYWGIVGVALGTAIPEILIKPVMHFYYKKVFDISMSRYYWNVWSRIIPLALALTALMLFQKQYAPTFSLPQLLLVAAVDGLLFWLASYWVLDTYERHVLRQILKRVFRST